VPVLERGGRVPEAQRCASLTLGGGSVSQRGEVHPQRVQSGLGLRLLLAEQHTLRAHRLIMPLRRLADAVACLVPQFPPNLGQVVPRGRDQIWAEREQVGRCLVEHRRVARAPKAMEEVQSGASVV